MQAENTLRRRLVLACVLLAVVIGGVFAAAAYVIIEAVEYELIETRLTRAADLLVQSDRAGAPVPSSPDLRFAVGARIPEEFRTLPPGVHQIESKGRILEVLIVEQAGQRYAVIDDVSEFERLEFIAFVGLWIAFFSGVLLALAIARASTNRIIAPLTTLAEAVQRDDLATHPELLAAADEIGVLARVFEARRSQLASILMRERFFTADVSHELRTPLTVILGAAELLTARLPEHPELRAAAERIRRASAETSVRVSALLQLARGPEGIEPGVLALRALVEQEIERCRPLLDGKQVALEFNSPDDVWVHASPDLAAVAVSNLLRNACHFTERGSVRVALGPDALVVEDTGPGVPQEVRRRLFEPFVRGSDNSSTGSGLGLSIVKRVAEHLGWTIRLDDAPHGGSRFTLKFSSYLSN